VKTCPHCGLVYEPTEGDTWAFTIIGDRLPVAAGIIVVYFELGSRLGRKSLMAVMAVLSAFLIWTAPNRWGFGVALLAICSGRGGPIRWIICRNEGAVRCRSLPCCGRRTRDSALPFQSIRSGRFSTPSNHISWSRWTTLTATCRSMRSACHWNSRSQVRRDR
jgi:hypothetical protein